MAPKTHKIFKIIGNILRIIYPFWIYMLILKVKNRIYTQWISAEFKYIGENCVIQKSILLRGGKYIQISNNVCIGKSTVITAFDSFSGATYTPEIIIEDNVNIGDECHITAIRKVHISKNVLIGRKVTITDHSHGEVSLESLHIPPMERQLVTKGDIFIGENVWIGEKATILSGVSIGQNSIIGANAVVTKDVPKNAVVVGIAANVIKML